MGAPPVHRRDGGEGEAAFMRRLLSVAAALALLMSVLCANGGMAEAAENGYAYVPYVISQIHREVCGEEAAALAEDILDAYIAYENSVPAGDEETAQMALAVARRSFPPFDAFARFNGYTAYKDGRVSWEMKQTKDEHEQTLDTFRTAIEGYLGILREGDCETARALALYKELLTGSRYDSSFNGAVVEETPVELTPYYFLLHRSGICGGYAEAYAYLLRQVGIDACDIMGLDEAFLAGKPGTPHAWVLMKLNGKYYFSDPTWESSSGELAYFCFTQEFRSSLGGGSFPVDSMHICGLRALEGFDISDTTFDVFRTQFAASLVKRWEFTPDRSGIVYTGPDGSRSRFAF